MGVGVGGGRETDVQTERVREEKRREERERWTDREADRQNQTNRHAVWQQRKVSTNLLAILVHQIDGSNIQTLLLFRQPLRLAKAQP